MRRLLIIFLLAVLTACSAPKAADSQLRIPDDQGVVTHVTVIEIQLDDKRTYKIRSDVESFAARSGETAALRGWQGRYVHIGMDNRRQVKWIAGLGIVPKVPNPSIFYTSTFDRYEKDYVVFEDGTAQRLAAGVRPPLRKGSSVLAIIDTTSHRAVTLRAQSG